MPSRFARLIDVIESDQASWIIKDLGRGLKAYAVLPLVEVVLALVPIEALLYIHNVSRVATGNCDAQAIFVANDRKSQWRIAQHAMWKDCAIRHISLQKRRNARPLPFTIPMWPFPPPEETSGTLSLRD